MSNRPRIGKLIIFLKIFYFAISPKLQGFFRKLKTNFRILYKMIRHYVRAVTSICKYYYYSPLFKWELKSFCFIVIMAYCLYYFVVIELSIRLFGYSYLCYWFLFIFLTVCLILAWRFEVSFLKWELNKQPFLTLNNWVILYNGSDPLSLFDFVTNYRFKPVFWAMVIKKHRNTLKEGRMILFTFFFILTFLFLYQCSYRFDPRFVGFVTWYFHPLINFFNLRKKFRVNDFISAPVRFWWWFFTILEQKLKANKIKIKKSYIWKARALTYPGHRISNIVDKRRIYKTSLRSVNRYSDIYFLRAAVQFRPIRRLVFQGDQPIITDVWFDPNWSLFFLRYLNQQFTSPQMGFWRKHFLNNALFWRFVKLWKIIVQGTVESGNRGLTIEFGRSKRLAENVYDYILNENYFETSAKANPLLQERFGAHWENYHMIVDYSKIPRARANWYLRQIFGTKSMYTHPHTLANLFAYQRANANPGLYRWKFTQWLRWKTEFFNLFNQTLTGTGVEDFIDSMQYNLDSMQYNLDVPLYLYHAYEFLPKLPDDQLWAFFTTHATAGWILSIYKYYSLRLNMLETLYGLDDVPPETFTDQDITFSLINKSLNRWLWLIHTALRRENEGIFEPSWEEIIDVGGYTFSWASIYTWVGAKTAKFKKLFDVFFKSVQMPQKAAENTQPQTHAAREAALAQQQQQAAKEAAEREAIKLANFSILDTKDLETLLKIELDLWKFEWELGLREANSFYPLRRWRSRAQPLLDVNEVSNYPWYVWTLKFFAKKKKRRVLPGFIRHYRPAPYPTVFSTFGSLWNKYQYWWRIISSTLVGRTDNLVGLKASAPLAIYTGVEAVLYLKNVFIFFDVAVKFFIWLITYPIEVILNQNFIPILNTTAASIFFLHFIWFLHFYIYTFIFLYCAYYFFIFYYRWVGFRWYYERMFEELTLINYNNRLFWHTLHHLWVNYKTPDQLLLLTTHTNLLLYYTFFEYIHFYYVDNWKVTSIVNLLVKLDKSGYFFWDYLEFIWRLKKSFKNPFKIDKLRLFDSFSKTKFFRFKSLLFHGGSSCSYDHLLWSYLEYLNQCSHFFSRALWWNHYGIAKHDKFSLLMRQLTIVLASVAPEKWFLFLTQPLLDTTLGWKLIIKFFSFLEKKLLSEVNLFKNQFFFMFSKHADIFSAALYNSSLWDFYMSNFISGLGVYDCFDLDNILSPSKLNTTSFWDDKRYWMLAFFWSCWFVPISWYPGLNLHHSYEDTWLHISRIAYSNSWIGQSTYVWPFFNIIQHIWWTAWINNRAASLVNTNLTLNSAGIGIFDRVWNFYEKWFFPKTLHIETIFGFVRTFVPNCRPYTYGHWRYYPTYDAGDFKILPTANANYDLSFDILSTMQRTTNWGHRKTNPPLNLLELNINPKFLLELFKSLNFPFSVTFMYLSFLNQLEYLGYLPPVQLWNLELEFDKLTVVDGLKSSSHHKFYKLYDFYLKEFDNLFFFSEKPLKHKWIFGFDVSFFFSHFIANDYFPANPHVERPAGMSINSDEFSTATNSAFLLNLDMLAKLWHETRWLKKPLGVLDKLELHFFKKYKSIKTLDVNSFTKNRDDVFLNLDTEHTVTKAGYAVYPKIDGRPLGPTYAEPYTGRWYNWSPTNPVMIKNSTSSLLLGWVGQLVNDAMACTNFLYSLNYMAPELNIFAWKNQGVFAGVNLLTGGGEFWPIGFFGQTAVQQEAYSRAFTWANVYLHPAASRYSFGPKAGAWFDYWSWKTAALLDYNNGFYSYRPYMGFWHALGTRLLSYDPLYGFYWTYWQVVDDPLNIDLSTWATDIFYSQDMWVQKAREKDWILDLLYYSDPRLYEATYLKKQALPYRELYYSFQHPYFLGYLIFWLLIQRSSLFYLGIVNFSVRWFLFREFLFQPEIYDPWRLWLSRQRWLLENWYRWQMFWYRLHYFNPIQLMSLSDCIIDDELWQPLGWLNFIHNFYNMNYFLFLYLHWYLRFSATEIWFLLDFKLLINFSLSAINWLAMDMPFSVNPFLAVNWHWTLFNEQQILFWYKMIHSSFSWPNTLKENVNFGLFYDWSSGIYLDSINLISYVGTYRGSTMLNSLFFDNPNYIASSFVWSNQNNSRFVASTIHAHWNKFTYHDILLSNDLTLHNLALVDFFQETIALFISYQMFFLQKTNSLLFLKVYFTKNKLLIKNWSFRGLKVLEIDSKFLKYMWNPSWIFKQLFFNLWFYHSISYDLLTIWLSTGFLFTNTKTLKIFLTSFRFWLYTRYRDLEHFYSRYGLMLFLYFFVKK